MDNELEAVRLRGVSISVLFLSKNEVC